MRGNDDVKTKDVCRESRSKSLANACWKIGKRFERTASRFDERFCRGSYGKRYGGGSMVCP